MRIVDKKYDASHRNANNFLNIIACDSYLSLEEASAEEFLRNSIV